MPELCFWSVADGDYSSMLQALVDSFRSVGMKQDFHVLCDQPIQGATTHPIQTFDKRFFFFKFVFLKNFIQKLDYEYYAFLDADNYFVRPLPPFMHLLQNSPLHAFFECDCTLPSKRKEWHCCPLPEYVRLMRECGVTSEKVYNANGGFFIVKREAVDTFCDLATDFWQHSMRNGYLFTEEAPLAYAMHMLGDDPEKHLLRHLSSLWCTDWLGQYAGRLPDGKPWTFADYMSYERFEVDPAIVHAIKSKEALIELGRRSFPERRVV